MSQTTVPAPRPFAPKVELQLLVQRLATLLYPKRSDYAADPTCVVCGGPKMLATKRCGECNKGVRRTYYREFKRKQKIARSRSDVMS